MIVNNHTKHLQALMVNPCSLKNRETIVSFYNAEVSEAEILKKRIRGYLLLLFITITVIDKGKELLQGSLDLAANRIKLKSKEMNLKCC